jgi:hypothetical protein
MGYGKGTSPQDQALEAQKQAWAEKYQAGQLSLEELKQKAAEAEYKSLAEARTAAATDAAQRRIDEATKQANLEKYQAGQLDYLTKKAERDADAEVFKNLVEHGGLRETDAQGKPNPLYSVYEEKVLPGITAKKAIARKAMFEENVNAALTKYQAADPKKKAAIDKDPAGSGIPADVYSEMLKRQNVAVAQPQGTATAPDEGRLPLSSLNTPTAPPGSDIFSEKGVRIGPSLVDARDYSKFPGSVEDLIRASREGPRRGQPIAESLFAQPGQSVAAAPATTTPTALNMPREEFNLIPESTDQYQPGAAFSRQGLPDLHLIPEPYQRPGVDLMVDDLLERLRGNRGTSVPMPVGSGYPFPTQGVFQPHPG